MNVELAGLTKRGKQIVKQHGAKWRVLDKRDTVLFSADRGPWLLVVPADQDQNSEASRWVRSLFDSDFKIMP